MSFSKPRSKKEAFDECREDCPGPEACEKFGFFYYPSEVNSNPTYVPCPLVEALRKQKAIEAAIGRTFPSEFARTSFESFEAGTHELAKALAAARQYTESEAWKNGAWMILSGPYGTGKTHLACAIGREAMRIGARTAFQLAAELGSGTFDEVQQRFRKLRDVDLLVVDDLSNEFVTNEKAGVVAREMFSLLDYFYSADKGLIITTNVPGKALPEAVGNRVLDRFRERALFVQVKGESYRPKMRGNFMEWAAAE